MKFNKSFGQNGQNLQTESHAEKLAVIGEAIAKIGDAIASIAAVLALEEPPEKGDNDEYKSMQKEIDHLTAENERLKNQLNNRRHNWL
ncbi:hypothetical protein PB01_08515 [Psychrobacillus glaciei]|uniref:Translation initiation factor 2 n=1 Tax=Psychrobacillus glaciei TaxID=2283160 RepID=A0A5J6SMC5_9BACI|nr:hypothetical protein [Psychrobacillus glaciei]QFF98872.1 hypothetical protein PB01_08515 [Psychrobacillus glaciei]